MHTLRRSESTGIRCLMMCKQCKQLPLNLRSVRKNILFRCGSDVIARSHLVTLRFVTACPDRYFWQFFQQMFCPVPSGSWTKQVPKQVHQCFHQVLEEFLDTGHIRSAVRSSAPAVRAVRISSPWFLGSTSPRSERRIDTTKEPDAVQRLFLKTHNSIVDAVPFRFAERFLDPNNSSNGAFCHGLPPFL